MTKTTRSCCLIVCIALISWFMFAESVFAAYPTDPTSDTGWPYSSENSIAAIQTRFNTARAHENSQLGTSVPMMTLPSQQEWNNLTDTEKALWLINREREDRGVAPLHGLESNVEGVAQYYAQYLLDNNVFGHYEDGNSPWERLDDNPAIGACYDFLNVSENLAVLWGGWTLPIERAVYMWMYDDSSSSWGHRHAILWYPYNDNGGLAGREGFLGIGRATGPHQGWSNSDIIVMNVFDPCASWDYGPTALLGDITGDGEVDLTDAMTALQIMIGTETGPVVLDGDVNGDLKIGLAEALFALRKMAGLH